MNRILFEKSEISDGVVTFGGVRAEHVLDVLHGEVGQILKTGEIDGPVGTAEITAIGGSGAARTVTVRVAHDGTALAPWVDLILAPPRPRVMKRLLPQLAALGVGRIVLVGAEKVERDFWGATLLKAESYRPLLVDGLMQAGTTALPALECWKSFNRFLREGLPAFTHTRRIVAHPYATGDRQQVTGREIGDRQQVTGNTMEVKNSAVSPVTCHPSPVLLAIGPEGGWTEPEVGKLESAGFVRYSLGPRILRTDTATVALLAQLMPR